MCVFKYITVLYYIFKAILWLWYTPFILPFQDTLEKEIHYLNEGYVLYLDFNLWIRIGCFQNVFCIWLCGKRQFICVCVGGVFVCVCMSWNVSLAVKEGFKWLDETWGCFLMRQCPSPVVAMATATWAPVYCISELHSGRRSGILEFWVQFSSHTWAEIHRPLEQNIRKSGYYLQGNIKLSTQNMCSIIHSSQRNNRTCAYIQFHH